jgi:hypothetical protein
LIVECRHATALTTIHFRKKGWTTGVNFVGIHNQAVNIWMDGHIWVPCDANRVIQYNGAGAWTAINLYVQAWMVPA